jgi:hypothetical protein
MRLPPRSLRQGREALSETQVQDILIDKRLFHYIHLEEVNPAWKWEDYVRDAINRKGSLTKIIEGKKNVGKSAKLLLDGYKVLGDWSKVLDYLIMNLFEFISLFGKTKGMTVRWLGVDDVNEMFPSFMYNMGGEYRQGYYFLSRKFDSIKERITIFEASTVDKGYVAGFILRHMDVECYVAPNHHFIENVWVKQFNPKDFWKLHMRPIVITGNSDDHWEEIPSRERKTLKGKSEFFAKDIPDWVWREYRPRRIGLTNEGEEDFLKVCLKLMKVETDFVAGRKPEAEKPRKPMSENSLKHLFYNNPEAMKKRLAELGQI